MTDDTQLNNMLARVPGVESLRNVITTARVPAWLVGGCVRDLLLERMPVDVDIATPNPEPLARLFAEYTGGALVPMDLERGIWRVAPSGEVYYDFCAFRDTDIIGDLRGRDFTINAIALRLPENGEPGGLLDPFGGLDDLNAGVLRMVSPHAFDNDPVRIIRAFRFVAELGLAIDTDTQAAMPAALSHLPQAAPERLLAEWWKLCGGTFAARAVEGMAEAGALDIIIPELSAAKGVTQNVYHHLDVWHHQLLTVANIIEYLRQPGDMLLDVQPFFQPLLDDSHRRARLVCIALLHDIGKPATRTDDDGHVHFYRHEEVGADITAGIARRLRMSREDTRALLTVIRQHLRPLFLLQHVRDGHLSSRIMGRFFDAVGRYAPEVMLLSLADHTASQGPATNPEVIEHLRDLYRALIEYHNNTYLPAQESPLLNGSDLIDTFNVPPGPRVGQLLHRARALQLAGKISTRDQALQWAATHLR